MQRLILLILSSFFLLLSCNKSKPKGTLSERTMVDLMADVHLVDGYLNTLPVDSTRKIIDGLYEKVFEKYGIDSVQFKVNVAYYMGNPVASKDLYAEVTKKLNAYENDYRKVDSLKNARISDSVRVAQRYERLKEAAQKLILDVHLDTIPLNYRLYQNDFMEQAGLQTINTYQPSLIIPDDILPDDDNGEEQPTNSPQRTLPNDSIKTAVEKKADKPVEN